MRSAIARNARAALTKTFRKPVSLLRRMGSDSKVHQSSFFMVSSIEPEFVQKDEGVPLADTVKGEVFDSMIDLQKVRPGEEIKVPYEITVSPALRDFWQSAFYSHDRINTSTPFARTLGLQDQPVPFAHMLFMAASMSHADSAKVQMGFKNARYHWPAFAGDTFTKKFIIKSLRNTTDGSRSILDIYCEITNQRDVVVFTCEKNMMFPSTVPISEVKVESPAAANNTEFIDHLVKMVETLQNLGSRTLSVLRPGQLILHTLTRALSQTHATQLATLGRLTHERHFNTRLYKPDELVLDGGLTLGLTTSLASRDLHEVLYEELLECTFPNEVAPGTTVGAMTFVLSREEHMSGDMEAIKLRTFGIKNLDVHRALKDKQMPTELFTGPLLMPKELEALLKQKCPELSGNIVCVADRKIFRQAPKMVPFLL